MDSRAIGRALVQAVPAVVTILVATQALKDGYYRHANREYTTPHVQPYTVADNAELPLDSKQLFYLTDVGCSLLLVAALFGFEEPPVALVHAISAFNGYGMQRLIIQGLKDGVGALRPNGDYGSFPSGHTGSAAAWCFYGLEWVLSKKTRTVPWYLMQVFACLCLMAYPWFVAGMRILGSYHYAADVTAGMFIGSVSAWMAFACQRNYKPVDNKYIRAFSARE